VANREAAAVVQQLAEAAERADGDLAHAMQERLDLCLGQLSEKNRQLIEWRYAEGRSSLEIARLLSTNDNAIRIALMRLRNALRDCMMAAQGG
jgi:RNA polymerase sigma-70 factor (ECF subfamily)